MRVFHKMITWLYDLIFKQILNEMYEDQSEARNLQVGIKELKH